MTQETNNGDHALHGGSEGFFNKVFQVRSPPEQGNGTVSVTLWYVSPDGEAGYPGELTTGVTYALVNGTDFVYELCATTDKKTPVSLLNHAYWNLAGHDSGGRGILEHTLHIYGGDTYTPVDAGLAITGDIQSVEAGGPLDFFSAPRSLGSKIDEVCVSMLM